MSVLIVEDEPLIAMMLEDFVDALGHRVAGTVDNVSAALDHIRTTPFDMAILDVHLRGGEPSWAVADALADQGKAFVVATGGMIDPPPARHADCPTLPKPFTLDRVESALEGLRTAGVSQD
ncbi:response regulator [Sphingomonas arantia]